MPTRASPSDGVPQVTMRYALRRLVEGAHRPPLVGASDGQSYVLKLGDQDPDFPACELVAALLAPAFGVVVPPIALVAVPEAMRVTMSVFGDAWRDLAAPQPGGLCFGSRWISGLTQRWHSGLAGRVRDPGSLAALLAFDIFIENVDRRAGTNPNLLLVADRVVAIDHGQTLPSVQGIQARLPHTYDSHAVWELVRPQRARLAALASLALNLPTDEQIDRAVRAVPEPWWRAPGRPAEVQRALRDRRASTSVILQELSQS